MNDGVIASACQGEVAVRRWPAQGEAGADTIAAEVAVALAYNGVSHVVMMMTPADLDDFALGFSLSEGIVERVQQYHGSELLGHDDGLELAVTIASERFALLKQLRRNLTGRTGCGLCGAESLEQAVRPVPAVAAGGSIDAQAIERALRELPRHQPLQQATGAVHAAAWCDGEGNIVCVREDVGRHNALDKLIGALARSGQSVAEGFALVSSRASYEMVSKSARAGMRVLVAVSGPTTLAVKLAESAGLTLAGFAREGRFSVYSAPARIGF